MRFRARAYQGVYWLKDLGTFDSMEEAYDALHAQGLKYYGEDDSAEDYEINHEAYWFDSHIEKVEELSCKI